MLLRLNTGHRCDECKLKSIRCKKMQSCGISISNSCIDCTTEKRKLASLGHTKLPVFVVNQFITCMRRIRYRTED